MSSENHLLQKRVNLFDGISIVTGSMIGSGIFIVSADIARNVGSPGWLMVIWLISGIITIIGAISYGELASMMPNVGGQKGPYQVSIFIKPVTSLVKLLTQI